MQLCFVFFLVLIPSKQIVSSTGDALFDGHEDGPLREDGSLAVTAGDVLKSFADIADVDEALLKELMGDDEVPSGSGSHKTFAVVRGNDTVGGGLVGMVLKDVGIEFGGVETHRACGWFRRD